MDHLRSPLGLPIPLGHNQASAWVLCHMGLEALIHLSPNLCARNILSLFPDTRHKPAAPVLGLSPCQQVVMLAGLRLSPGLHNKQPAHAAGLTPMAQTEPSLAGVSHATLRLTPC
ncbi:hypothetical protein ACFX15_034889 [Malus domestica]